MACDLEPLLILFFFSIALSSLFFFFAAHRTAAGHGGPRSGAGARARLRAGAPPSSDLASVPRPVHARGPARPRGRADQPRRPACLSAARARLSGGGKLFPFLPQIGNANFPTLLSRSPLASRAARASAPQWRRETAMPLCRPHQPARTPPARSALLFAFDRPAPSPLLPPCGRTT